jgi:N,N'-diacetyllegionaminate synthase
LKTTIIAEVGSNWEGNMVTAKKIISECKNAGADAVKFQMWRAKDLYNNTNPNWEFIKKSELTFKKTRKLKEIADNLGIEFFCSAFYPEAIDLLEAIKVKRYKIASRTCLFKDPFSLEVLEKKSHTKKPIIISMGMGGDFKKIQNIFSKNKKIFCYCISNYPTNIEEIKWKNAIKYDGFSDHTLGISAALIFAILKKQQNTKNIVIEKHVKLIDSKGPDASSSIDTNELKELVTGIRQIEKLKT